MWLKKDCILSGGDDDDDDDDDEDIWIKTDDSNASRKILGFYVITV
jgi:hypothetical protein